MFSDGDIKQLNDNIVAMGAFQGITTQIAPDALAVDLNIYQANDVVGGKLTFTNVMRENGGTALLQSLLLVDASNQKPALELIIFNADPSASTTADHGALTIASADVPKIIRRISINAADYIQVGGVSIVDLSPGTRVLKSGASTRNLYMVMVTTGTPDFVAATDLSVRLGILRD